MPSAAYTQLIQDFVVYRDDPSARTPDSTTIAALLYAMQGGAGGAAGSTASGSASTADSTEARQIELIAKNELIHLLLQDIKTLTQDVANLHPDNVSRIATPDIKEMVNTTTTPAMFDVAAGAWSVNFWLIEGVCKVNGYSLRVDNSFGFPVINGSKYPVFNCELGPASTVQVIEVRD